MAKNIVTVGPSQLVAVQMLDLSLGVDPSAALCGPIGMNPKSAMEIISNRPAQETRVTPRNIDSLIYAAMLQAGVDLFRIPKLGEKANTLSQYLEKHVEYYPQDEYVAILNDVRRNLLKFIPGYDFEKSAWSTVNDVENFLVELFLATNRGTNIVFLTLPPTQKEVEESFPAEFSFIFNNLLSAFHQETLRFPVPQSFISTENVQQFNEILDSDLFHQYSEAQNEISIIQELEATAIANLVQKSAALLRKFSDIASPKDTAISVLEVTPKVINHIFGSLSGDIVEFLSKPLKRALSTKRRIVAYDLSNILFEITHKSLISRFGKGANDDFSVCFPMADERSTALLQKFMGRAVNEGASKMGYSRLRRNEPCPCGSGKRFKQCHGRLST
jgi:hypothetical protein